MVYFVMSHAAGDDDTFARRFFDDLSAAVRERITPAAHDKVGYYDGAGADAGRWPTDARMAIATAQTFIPLLSPRYLRNDRCGRSWSVFAARITAHEISTGHRHAGFIPVVWNSQGLSEAVLTSHGITMAPQRTPGGEDLRVLIRLRRHHDEYRAFVNALSHRVVETVRAERLPPSPPGTDLTTARNAFAVDGSHRSQVVLVVVADTKEKMRPIRGDLQFYGLRGEDWAPYQPSMTQPLVSRARELVAQRLIDSEVVSIEAFSNRLTGDGQGKVFVLLVDAWTTRLEHWRNWLTEIGQRHEAGVVVMVPLSLDDAETCAHSSELRRAMLQAFPDRAGPRDYLFRLGIGTAGAFDSDLATALATASQPRSHHPPMNPRTSARPILGSS